jgi:hypothetical protein
VRKQDLVPGKRTVATEPGHRLQVHQNNGAKNEAETTDDLPEYAQGTHTLNSKSV